MGAGNRRRADKPGNCAAGRTSNKAMTTELVDTTTGEVVSGTVTDVQMAVAVVEADKTGNEVRRIKAELKDAKESHELACEVLLGLTRKRFCPDAAPLFEEAQGDDE